MRSGRAVALATPVARPAPSWGRRGRIDLDTGVVVAVRRRSAPHWKRREEPRRWGSCVDVEDLSDLVADKRYHPREVACCRRVSSCLLVARQRLALVRIAIMGQFSARQEVSRRMSDEAIYG